MFVRRAFCRGLGGVLIVLLGRVHGAEVIPMDADWRFLRGTREASSPDPTAWRAVGFDDSAWEVGPAPFWYGEAQSSPGTILTDMRGGYTSVFLRRTFSITRPADISEVELIAQSDDGFIAWLNGHEIARFNVPDGELPYNRTSLPALPEPIPPVQYTVTEARDYLVAGTNVLAVHGFNASIANSSDFVFNAALTSSVDLTPPVMTVLLPEAGATVRTLRTIEVGFSEPVVGVDAQDLRVNGLAATNRVTVSPSQFVFEFPQPPTGRVDVAWAAGHGMRDQAGTPNAFAGGAWHYTLNPDAPVPGVMISEFMAENDDTLNDEDGDSSDWIELQNPTTATVNLNGWYLTDSASAPTKWRLPNVALPARGFLLIFASGKDRTVATAPLHTNFRLSNDGGYLALLDPTTNIVSEFAPAYPTQFGDISYGRDRLATEVTGYFLEPTPGKANAQAGPGFAPAVSFSRPGGSFIEGFELVLTTPTPGASIYYTLNGTLPTNTATLYTGPIPIASSVLVRARALASGRWPGPIRSEGYVALGPTVLNRTFDLPQVIVHNFGGGAYVASTDRPSYLTVFEPVNGISSLTNRVHFRGRAGLNLRGSSTEGYPKRSYAVELWNEFDDDDDRALLGMPAQSDWVLYAPNNFEPVLIHNPYIFELSRRLDRYAPRTRFVELYVNTTAAPLGTTHYQGVYVLMEKIKRDPRRVDVANLEPEHTQPPQVTGGYVLKIDRQDWNERSFYSSGVSIIYVDPKGPEIELPQRRPQQQYIQNYFDAFYSALSGPNFRDPVTGYAAYVDIPSWLDHHILNILAFNVDALRLSGFFFKPREGKLEMGPIWDFDRALGSTDGRDANPRLWRSGVPDYGTDMFNRDGIFANPWYGRMFADLDFWQAWIDRWQELRRSEFSLTNLHDLVESLAAEVWAAQAREVAKWPGHSPRNGSYRAEVDLMKRWLSNRVDFIDTNFLAAPALGHPGGQVQPGTRVSLNGPSRATLYYTTDGSDPRLAGGAISPAASPYVAPIPITENRRLVVRALDPNHRNLTGPNKPPLSSPWSGPVAATYIVQRPPLVVSEIMYHPAPLPAGDTNDVENLAFIEIKNVGSATIRLVGCRFSDGIRYTFTTASGVTDLAPGEFAVLAKDPAAFLRRYPGVTHVVGGYEGSLDNAGERVRFEGPMQEPIADIRYDARWQPATDGLGFSLVLLDDHSPPSIWSQSTAWRRSSAIGGSPGRDDPPLPNIPTVWVNEALTHTDLPTVDAIELLNPGESPADISGWFLSDDFGEPRKFVFPAGTIFPAGGFLSLTEADFNTGPQAFSLSSLGDELYLFSGDGVELTGFVHGFEFGAAANGVPFGRHRTSTGLERFVAQATTTLGAANAGPRVGPILLSELMFEPPRAGTNNNTLDEFIELRNSTSFDIPLFDPLAPTHPWRLRGGVSFDLPALQVLPANGYLLLVNFDPDFDFGPLTAFKARYQVPDGVPILGPYEGNLNNAGERVALYRPDPPQAPGASQAGLVPYVLVDEVRYSPLPPWPTGADGSGHSLQRIGANRYGDDPASWQVAAPTAGQPNAGESDPDWDRDGLPNEWEETHGLDPRDPSGDNGPDGDPDEDGLTNTAEHQAGTHPRDAGSRLELRSVELNDAETLVRFEAIAEKTYSLLYTDDLRAAPWQRLDDVPAEPFSREVVVRDPARAGARFYRLVTPALPSANRR